MNVWFSSDWHLKHRNIAGPKVSSWKKGYRDFADEHVMTETIIENVNKYVKEDDILYYLGDFAFGDLSRIPEHRNRIKCKTIHYVLGNHDKEILKFQKSHNLFTSVRDVHYAKFPSAEIFMSHYSHQVWNKSHRGVLHLFGHSHDSIKGIGRSMDVGVDTAYRLTGEYRPFHLDEIIKELNKIEIPVLDHHESTI